MCTEFLGRSGDPLSHAERQMVCLARAYYQKSDYILVDGLRWLDHRGMAALASALADPLKAHEHG